jgi:hypothetical protein
VQREQRNFDASDEEARNKHLFAVFHPPAPVRQHRQQVIVEGAGGAVYVQHGASISTEPVMVNRKNFTAA